MMKGYYWDKFIVDRRTTVGTLVSEFYTNTNECNGTTSWVRGFIVHYSKATINKYYKLAVRQNNAAYIQCLSTVTPAMILEVLRSNETVDWAWTIGADRKPKLLKESRMNRDVKALNRFLVVSFMPSGYTSETIYAKCRVIYAIMVGMALNVGRIIKDDIVGALKMNKATTSLNFPLLITKMCVNAGAEYSFTEELLQGKPFIRVIDLFCRDGAVVVSGIQTHQQAPRPAVSSSSVGSDREYYEQRFDAITAEQ